MKSNKPSEEQQVEWRRENRRDRDGGRQSPPTDKKNNSSFPPLLHILRASLEHCIKNQTNELVLAEKGRSRCGVLRDFVFALSFLSLFLSRSFRFSLSLSLSLPKARASRPPHLSQNNTGEERHPDEAQPRREKKPPPKKKKTKNHSLLASHLGVKSTRTTGMLSPLTTTLAWPHAISSHLSAIPPEGSRAGAGSGRPSLRMARSG